MPIPEVVLRDAVEGKLGLTRLRAKVVGDERPLGHHRSLRSRRSLGSIGDLDRFRVANPRNQARRPSHRGTIDGGCKPFRWTRQSAGWARSPEPQIRLSQA